MDKRRNIVVTTVSKVVLLVVIQLLIFVFRLQLFAFVFHFDIFLNYLRSLLLNARDAFVELSSGLNIGCLYVKVTAELRLGFGYSRKFDAVANWLVNKGQNFRNFSDGGQLLLLGLHAVFSAGVRLH
jgi:hypothetical protein